MEETTRFHEERLPESPRRQARDGDRLQLPHQQPPQEQGLDQHPEVATQQPEYGDGLHAFLVRQGRNESQELASDPLAT
jgi:hypothetical protein